MHTVVVHLVVLAEVDREEQNKLALKVQMAQLTQVGAAVLLVHGILVMVMLVVLA
tara:strand:+ start:686 stop:850 length:165 start_codon:yes stop_codon:yes gene_type:complete